MRRPATEWARGPRLRELFGDRVHPLRLTEHAFRTRFVSFSDWFELYRNWYGPTNKTFAELDEREQHEYIAGLKEIVQRHNHATDKSILASYEYVNIIGTKAT